MYKFCLLTLALVMTVSLEEARAQAPGPSGRPSLTPSRRPVTSPYLNLLGGAGGGSTAFQYYRRVLPEVEFRRSDALNSRAIQALERDVTRQQLLLQSRTSQLGVSGHRTSFLNYGGYFPQTGGAAFGRR